MGIDKEIFEKAKEQAVNKMLERYFKDYDDQTKIAIKQLFEAFLEAFMLGEREIFLQHHPQDKGSGAHAHSIPLEYHTTSTCLEQEGGEFRPSILPV